MMVNRCPACGARNPGVEVCRRCECELLGLARILDTARYEEQQSVRCLLRGEIAQARTHAEHARILDQRGLGSVLTGFLSWADTTQSLVSSWRADGVLPPDNRVASPGCQVVDQHGYQQQTEGPQTYGGQHV